jgi:ribosomal protein S18 acetylase RimI-like enzyme
VAAAELPDAVAILARAFETDDMFRFLLPDATTRVAWLRFVMGAMVRLNQPHGLMFRNGDDTMQAVITLAPPGRYAPSYQRLAGYLLERSTWKAGAPSLRFVTGTLRLLALIDRMHLKEPHYYVECLGVEPDHQGKGLGRTLLEPVLAMADREHVPTYLETSNPKNLSFYRRFGFDVTAEVSLSGGYPPLWTLLRHAPQA